MCRGSCGLSQSLRWCSSVGCKYSLGRPVVSQWYPSVHWVNQWHSSGIPVYTRPASVHWLMVWDESAPPPPRSLLVKLATRRSKNRVMAARKKLRNVHNRPNANPNEPPMNNDQQGDTKEAITGDDCEDENWLADGRKIYIVDDLTKMRGNLAYESRKTKRNGEIAETWVIDTKIMIKTNHSRISQIFSLSDLRDKIRHGWNCYYRLKTILPKSP